MNHPIFGSRIWKLDNKVTTPDLKHYMKFIEDRPNLLNDLKEILGWYDKSGRSLSDESILLRYSIQNLESGRLVEDSSIARIEKIAEYGIPTNLDQETFDLAKEMLELSDHPDVSLDLASDLRTYSRQLSGRGLKFTRRKIDPNLDSLAKEALDKARDLVNAQRWFPSGDEVEKLKNIKKLLATQGLFYQNKIYEFSKAKQYLNLWLDNYDKNDYAAFSRRFYELLASCVSEFLEELDNPSFKPSDLVKRTKKPLTLSKKWDMNSVLLVLDGPKIYDFPGGKGLYYVCFEPGHGETKVSFDEIKKVKFNSKRQ